MTKRVIRTDQAPAPFQGAPYSQAIKANGFVFVSGQLGLAPGGSEMVGPGIEEQTSQVLDNLEAILTEAGTGLDRLLKTTVFLANLDDFQAMNGVYKEFFPTEPPARTTVGVAGLVVPGALIEIECIAAAKK